MIRPNGFRPVLWLVLVFFLRHQLAVADNEDFRLFNAECDFQTRNCNWTWPTARTGWKWGINNATKGTYQLDGPPFNGLNGFYLGTTITDDYLLSPKFQHSSSKKFCFTFFYYLITDQVNSNDPDRLILQTITKSGDLNVTENIWRSSAIFGDYWHYQYVDLELDNEIGKPFQLRFNVYGKNGLVALRDFRIEPRQCQEPSNKCDFESGWCGWKQTDESESSLRFEWKRASETNIKPAFDHTTRSSTGHLLSVHDSQQTRQPITGKLRSPQISMALRKQCFIFFIRQTAGNGNERWRLILRQHFTGNDLSVTVWQSGYKEIVNEWIRIQVSLDFSAASYLEFEATIQSPDATLEFDDFSFEPYRCNMPITCSFYRDLCGWNNRNETADNFEWTIGSGRVRYSEKLPFKSNIPFDNYAPRLYSDFTPLSIGTTGQMEIVSEIVTPDPHDGPEACIRFYFDVFSFDTSTDFFGVYLEKFYAKLPSERSLLWKFNGPVQKNSHGWQIEDILLKHNRSMEFRLVIQAKSQHPSTYIRIELIQYLTSFQKCGSVTESTTKSTKTTTPIPTVIPRLSLDCTFEQGNFCHWQKHSGFNVTDAKKLSSYSIFEDHTLRSSNGHFISILSDDETLIHGILESPNSYLTHPTTLCFMFFYFLHAPNTNGPKIEVNAIMENGKIIRIFQTSETNELGWHPAIIDLNHTMVSKIDRFRLEATVHLGIAAIDDIKLTEAKCIRQLNYCDFELGNTCGMLEPIENPDGFWEIYPANRFYRPSMIDHSTHSSSGHFYGTILGKNDRNKRLEVSTPIFSPHIEYCFRFSYYITDNITISYRIRRLGMNIPIWSVSGTTNGMWLVHQWEIERYELSYNILMEIRSPEKNSINAMAFIDDIFWYRGKCRPPSTVCTFDEGDFCTISNVFPRRGEKISVSLSLFLAKSQNYSMITSKYLSGYTDNVWRIYSPMVNDENFLPYDHTQGDKTGNYLVFKNIQGWRASMVTERYPLTKQIRSLCLSFAVYSSHPNNILEVYQGESYLLDKGMKLWNTNQSFSRTGVPSMDWKVFEIQANALNESSTDMFFYIIGTIGANNEFLAIDDVQIKLKCDNPSNIITTKHPIGPTTATPIDRFRCEPTDQWIPMEKVCDHISDCPDGYDEKYCGECTFENHFWCRYTYSYDPRDPTYIWRFSDNSTIGPKDDYMRRSVTASGTTSNLQKRTILYSPWIHQSYRQCLLRFNYRTESANSSASVFDPLSVYIHLDEPNIRVMIWQSTSILPFENENWHVRALRLGRIKHKFRVEYEAHPYQSSAGFVSLSSIHMFSCDPPIPARNEDQCMGKFRCKYNRMICIDQGYVCDMADDCGDGSDEMVPSPCDPKKRFNFENGLQGWGQTYRIGWELRSTDQQTDFRIAPPFDHTTGFTGGHYLFGKDGKNHPKLIIDSPPFSVDANECNIIFYVLKNSQNSTLFIKLWDLNTVETKVLTWTNYFQESFWSIRVRVPGKTNHLFRILIEATLNQTKDNFVDPYIAIDDIVFGTGCTIQDHGPSNVTTPTPCIGILCHDSHGKQICVPELNICDYVKQCRDGEDEKNCGDCNFDNGTMCQWKSEGNSDAWKVYKPASMAVSPLPKKDGSNHSTGGYVAISQRIPARSSAQFGLISPRINAKTASECELRFQVMSSITVYIRVMVGNTNIRQVSGYFEQWTSIRALIGHYQPGFNVRLLASVTGYVGPVRIPYRYLMVVVDNIQMVNCDPNHTRNDTKPGPITLLNCDFETDYCGWTVSSTDGRRGNFFRTNLPKDEPGDDHTGLKLPQPEKYGNWISSQTRDNLIVKNQMKSEHPIKPTQTQSTYCLRFWYYFFGVELSRFVVFIEDLSDRTNQTIWIRQVPDTRTWKEAFVEIPRSSDDMFHIYFEADASSSTVIGIDDVNVTDKACPVASYEYCDFEVNNCDWQVKGGDFQRSTGSISDHTTGTQFGHYLLDSQANKNVSIIKPLNKLPFFINTNIQINDFCFNLYFYFGAKLPVSDLGGHIWIKLFRGNFIETVKNISLAEVANENSLNRWTLLSANFRATPTDRLMVYTYQDSNTQLMLDDLTVKSYSCLTEGCCDFEYDLCGWYNDLSGNGGTTNANIIWTRVQPTNRFAKRNGMPVDHTLYSRFGNYLALTLDMQGKARKPVRLISPVRTRTNNPICFRMYYFARKSSKKSNATAIVLQVINLINGRSLFYDAINGTDQLRWVKYEKQIDHPPGIFNFWISGQYNTLINSDIGIDDITIEDGPCNNGGSTTTPRPIPDSEKIADCDFEGKKCQWTYAQSVWNVTSFRNEIYRNIFAPAIDHTRQTEFGHYLILTNESTQQENSYQFISPWFTYDRDRCLTLWYYHDGEDPFYLDFWQAYDSDSNFMTIIGQYGSSTETRRWQLVRITVPYLPENQHQKTRVQMNFKPGSNRRLFMVFAIDDFRIRPGHCSHQYDYTYTFTKSLEDLDFLQLQPATGAEKPLRIYPNPQDQFDNVPEFDHTTFTPKGYYLLFKNKDPSGISQYFIDTISMLHMPLEYGTTCIRFAYQNRGAAGLKVYVLEENQQQDRFSNERWQISYDTPFWTMAEFNIDPVDYPHKVVFKFVKSYDQSSFVAIDDITVLPVPCELPGNCKFNQGRYCSYTRFKNDSVNYYFEVFNTPAIDLDWPGPQYDHGGGNYGGYLFLTAYRAGTHTEKLRAITVSGPRIILRSSYCLTLWTVINSPDAELRVSIIRKGMHIKEQNQTVTAFVMSGVEQTEWTSLSFTLNPALLNGVAEVQIVIQGTLGTNQESSIAIDDISLVETACDNSGLICPNGVKVNEDKICNFVRDCPDGMDELHCGDCDFERDLCGWTNTLTWENHHWERVQVSDLLVINQHAPKMDGSGSNTGHYVVMRPTGSVRAGHSELALNYHTPRMFLKRSYKSCTVTFDFYIETKAKYYITLAWATDGVQGTPFYLVSREATGGWRRAMAHLGQRKTPFFLIFEAYQEDLAQGVVAIDNVRFSNCTRPKPLPPKKECPEGQILCKRTRICIDQDDLCDNVDDCGDMSDEQRCFKNHICSFTIFYECEIVTPNDPETGVFWSVSDGMINRRHELIPGYEPPIDNTVRNQFGQYYLLSPRKTVGHRSKDYAEFFLPIYRSKSSNERCHVRFFYYMHGDPDEIFRAKIEIFARSKDEKHVRHLATVHGSPDKQQRWTKEVIIVGNENIRWKPEEPFILIFRGIPGNDRTRIAIDDISYGDGCIRIEPTPTTHTPPPTKNPPTPTPSPNHHQHKIAAVWIFTLVAFVMIGSVGAYYGRRRFLIARGRSSFLTNTGPLSMRNIEQKLVTDDDNL